MKILAIILLTAFAICAQDTERPVVQITYPANYSTVTVNTKVTITATATDNVRVLWVQFMVDGKSLCVDTEFPYSCDWTPTRKKDYNVFAKAIDPSSNSGTAQAHLVTAGR